MERKVPRSFVDGGVGLGIVAAMTDSGGDRTREWTSHLAAAASMRSSPIPIISLAKPAAANFNSVGLSPPRREIVGSEAGSVGSGSVSLVDESDEFYTCVVSHVGNQKVISKFVYYGDKVSGFRDDPVAVFDVNPGMFYASSSPLVINPGGGGDWRSDSRNQDFLASCHLCKKLLHGLDIFMYRGEKAFCSVECRGKQIRLEKRKEKYGGEVRKPHDCSLSPCSSPQVYLAEVAAA